jgi:hypothetical protein
MCGESETQDSLSALKHNQETKGTNSYYYAHTRSFEVPADAKVVSGPGLITGGAPVLLEKAPSASEGSPEKRAVIETIRNYSWSEEDNVVKVACDGGDVASATEANTECDFNEDSFTLRINLSEAKTLQLQVSLKKNVDPSKCKFRISKGKGVRLILTKKETGKWYDLLKTASK